MAKRSSLVVLSLFLSGCARLSGCAGGDPWAIEKIDERWNTPEMLEDLVTFKNGETWENVGMKAERVAEISGPAGSRVIAFRALSCVECEPDVLLTLRSTAGKNFVSTLYPGKLTAIAMDTGVKASAPVVDIRVFFGGCLDEKSGEVFISETKSLPDGKVAWKAFVPTESGIESRDLAARPKALSIDVPSGCREMKPIDREVDG